MPAGRIAQAATEQCRLLMQHTTRWVGWPGECLPEGPERDAVGQELCEAPHPCAPVWIPKDTLDLYYNGFCNAVLWQLFHYVPVQMDFRLAETHTLTQEWLAYQQANQLFADAVAADHREGDIVWIQDYHLMLLPEMLKQKFPTMKVRSEAAEPCASGCVPFRRQGGGVCCRWASFCILRSPPARSTGLCRTASSC